MAFNHGKFFKSLRIYVPLIFSAGLIGGATGIGLKSCADAKERARINEYVNVLRASGEVGSVETNCVLPFGDRQIILTTEYTDAAKSVLEPQEYNLFLQSFYTPLKQINDLQVGYNFSLASEDGSFGLPTPTANVPSVNWTVDSHVKSGNNGETVIGEWNYTKDAFSENYFYSQYSSTINSVSFPTGLIGFPTEESMNNLEPITIYGKEYSPERMLYTFKIVTHEVFHSLGVGHTNSSMNIPKNEGNVLETYMTPKLNMFFAGDSKFDENTLIASTCLRKILSGTQNQYDKYFNPAHYETFEQFMQQGRENLNNQAEKQ